MRGKIRLFVVVGILAFWLGGLTFYAAVVVPIANRVVGSDQQGLVTQQATVYLNWLGVGAAGLLFGNAVVLRSRGLLLTSLVLAIAQAALFLIHGQLDGLLASQSFDADDFYAVHRRYLLVTTCQWLTGLVALWLVLARRGNGNHPA